MVVVVICTLVVEVFSVSNIISRTKPFILANVVFGLMLSLLPTEVGSTEFTKTGDRKTTANSAPERETKKPKFPDRGIPTGRRRGGTSRGQCSLSQKSLTAIVPGKETVGTGSTSDNSSKSFLAKTVATHPNFWVYIPELTDASQQGEFILQDENDRDIYRTLFDLPSKSGITNIKLPPRSPNLVDGQKYHWYVKVFCDENRKSAYIFVDAWIKKVAASPELQQQLNSTNVSNLSKYKVLSENKIWHDAIDSLAEVVQEGSHSSREQKRWNQLLSNLGLADLINRSMLDIRASSLAE